MQPHQGGPRAGSPIPPQRPGREGIPTRPAPVPIPADLEDDEELDMNEIVEIVEIDVQARKQELRQTTDKAKGRFDAFMGIHKRQADDLKAARAEIEQLKQQLETSTHRQEDLARDLTEATANLAQTKLRVRTLEEACAALDAQNAKLKENERALRKKLGRANKALVETDQAIDYFNQLVDQLDENADQTNPQT